VSPLVPTTPQLRDPELFRELGCIDGAWVAADSGATLAIHNPADASLLGHVPRMGAAETDRAVAAAGRALPAWRSLSAGVRARMLRDWFDLIISHQEDLARLMTLEQGKPLAEARNEIVYAASFIEWFAEEGKRVYGDTIPGHQTDKRILVIRQPVGVTAAITPWNFPAAMLTRKAGAALAAGCTMVAKPASQTPFSALALVALAQRAGIPPGVLNIVTGEAAAIGSALCSNPTVRKLSFTGSTEVGRQLLAQCAPDIKKVSLELGGNAPFIVFEDADIDSAVEGAFASKYRNAGQTCVCSNRFYVQEGVYDEFVKKFAAKVQTAKVGNGFEDGVNQGPLIEEAALTKVQRHVDDAVAKGGRVVVGGKRLSGMGSGQFFEPTVVADATADMLCAKEETFGPFAPIFKFKTEQEAVYAANNTEFGLASYFYSRDVGRIFRVSEALEYGMVGINVGILATEHVPFGGVKQSGLGREGSHHGMDDYVEIKFLCMGDILK